MVGIDPAVYWAFIAPDFDSFRAALEPVLPAVVPIPGIGLVPKDVMILQAWGQPFHPFGLAARLYWLASHSTSVSGAIDNAWNAVVQATASAPNQRLTIGGGSAVAPLVIANTYRCALRMASGTHDIVNVFHVEGSASGQQAAAAAAVLAAWKVASGPLAGLSSLNTMQDVTAMDLSSTSGGITVVTDATAGGISATNSLATRGACALVKLNGGTRSRSTRGRVYFGPIMESQVNADGATLTSGAITAIGTSFGNFRTSLSGAGFTLVIASRKLSTITAVTSVAVETTIATQRRRIRS